MFTEPEQEPVWIFEKDLHAYNFASFFPSYLVLPPAAEATEIMARTSKMLGGEAGIPYGI